MLETSLKLLKKITDAGFEAYIVGGFVRDYLLGIESNDVDICTNAKSSDIRKIFKDSCLPPEAYGSVTLNYKNITFEITTFRVELSYLNNRKPEEIKYIDDLETDLKRRDFLINTICMDKDGNIIDLLNGKEDLNKKIINSVGNCDYKFNQDSLRILRAVRIATSLNFELSDEIKNAINSNKNLLYKLSYQRKKQELEKIFTSPNIKKGISLLLEFSLDEVLEINNLKNIVIVNDILGIWAQLDMADKYPFTKNEQEIIMNIKLVLERSDITHKELYKYGLYVCSIAGDIKGIDRKKIAKMALELPIKTKKDIDIFPIEIADLLDKKPGPYLKDIIADIEEKIISFELANEKYTLKEYVIKKYN